MTRSLTSNPSPLPLVKINDEGSKITLKGADIETISPFMSLGDIAAIVVSDVACEVRREPQERAKETE